MGMLRCLDRWWTWVVTSVDRMGELLGEPTVSVIVIGCLCWNVWLSRTVRFVLDRFVVLRWVGRLTVFRRWTIEMAGCWWSRNGTCTRGRQVCSWL